MAGEDFSYLRRGREGMVVGTVNYETGTATLDLSKMQDDLYYDVSSSEYTFTEPPASNDWAVSTSPSPSCVSAGLGR
jgi:hypothetical protein